MVRGITNTNERTQIWLANLTSLKADVPDRQVVLLAERVKDAPEGEQGHGGDGASDLDGMV